MSRTAVPSILALILVAGCETFHEPKFNAPVGAADGPLLLVPFREPARNLWYGESDRGIFVSASLMAWARSNTDATFAEGREVDEALRVVRDWQAEEIAFEDWLKIARPLGVKYLLYGQIEKLSLSKPGTIGIVDASVQATYCVLDVEARKTSWRRDSFAVGLTKGRETDAPILSMGADAKQIEDRLLTKLGATIGQDVYGYEEPFTNWDE